MQQELRLTTEVLPGGKIEVASPDLTAGDVVDITIARADEAHRSRKRSIVKIVAEAPGQVMFKSINKSGEYVVE